MAYYFRLYTKIYAATDHTFSNTALMVKDDISESSSGYFIGVGFPNEASQFQGPVIGFPCNQVVSETEERENIESIINWPPGTQSVDCRGILFTYRGNYVGSDENAKNLWRVIRVHHNYETNETECVFAGMDDNTPTGKMVFSSFDDFGNSEDPNVSPFHFHAIESNLNFLCFNSEDETEQTAKSKKNGKNWYCRLYIIDPDSPAFDRKPDVKGLELPSVYKPLYMRCLLTIDNTINNYIHKAYFLGNVYNGVGYCRYDRNNARYYNVGNLKCDIGNQTKSFNITSDTPTLIANYENSIHTITKTQFENVVQSLDDITTDVIFKEDGPDINEQALFPVNQIEERKTVSFYNISYNRMDASFSEGGETYYCCKLSNCYYTGNSSSSVRYFAVSPFLYDIITGGTINKLQKYEVNPEEVVYTDYKQFLSLYGCTYFKSYNDYRSQRTHYLRPNDTPYVIQVDPTQDGELVLVDHKGGGQGNIGKWYIIGMTDPLVDLLVQDENLFDQERYYGNVLPPHKNFVSIITYK